MGFVEEKNQFRFFRIADFRQALEQFRQQPQQEGGIEFRRVDQFIGSQNVDDSLAATVGLHQIVKIKGGLAKNVLAALAFELKQRTLDCADARGRDVPVLSFEARRVVANVLQHGSQVFQIEEQ